MCHPRFVTFVDARHFYLEEVIDGFNKGLMEIVDFSEQDPREYNSCHDNCVNHLPNSIMLLSLVSWRIFVCFDCFALGKLG